MKADPVIILWASKCSVGCTLLGVSFFLLVHAFGLAFGGNHSGDIYHLAAFGHIAFALFAVVFGIVSFRFAWSKMAIAVALLFGAMIILAPYAGRYHGARIRQQLEEQGYTPFEGPPSSRSK